MWQVFADMGLKAVQAYYGAKVQKVQNEANNFISKENSLADTKVKLASNAMTAAQTSLARAIQSENNNAQLVAGGRAIEASQINTLRELDAAASASFEDQLRFAEEAGSQAAAAAWAGVGGSVVDTVSAATALRRSRSEQSAMQAQGYFSFDAAQRAADIMSQTVRSLDTTVIMDQLDYTKLAIQEQSSQSPFAAALFAAAGSAIQNWQTLAPTPKAPPVWTSLTTAPGRKALPSTSFGYQAPSSSLRLGG